MKKKQKQQDSSPKRTLEDYPLQLPCQVSLEDYQDYALFSSQESRKKVRRRTALTSAVLTVVGLLLAVYGSAKSSWAYNDLVTVLGVLVVAFALTDVFYQFFLFPSVLRRNIAKEYRRDSRLGRELIFCFGEDHMSSFYEGVHQGTFFYDEVLSRQENQRLLLLSLKNGKIIVFPKAQLAGAAPEIRQIIDSLGR